MINEYVEYLTGIDRIVDESGARIAYRTKAIETQEVIWRGSKSIVVMKSLKEAEALEKKLKNWAKKYISKKTEKPYKIFTGIGYAEGICEIVKYPVPVTMKNMSKNAIKEYVVKLYDSYNRGKPEESREDPSEKILEVEKTLSYNENYTVSFYKRFGMAYMISYYNPIEQKRIRKNLGDVFILYNETSPENIRVETQNRQRKKRSNTVADMADFELSLSPYKDMPFYIRIE